MLSGIFRDVNGVDAHIVRAALLQRQYFPNIKVEGEELPDIFSSESFSEECADALFRVSSGSSVRCRTGWVELRTRRFDGLVRRLGVPHPMPYVRLVSHLCSHWEDLAPFLESRPSRVKPSFHSDGRVIQMDYEPTEAVMEREVRLAHGMRFLVRADISSCFPSIYSHAVDWALRGKTAAKKRTSDGSWQELLDKRVRDCHDGETKGIMIGPAISNIVAEIVLQRVDDELEKGGYSFIRHIDDYTMFCVDRQEAEQFVVALQRTLAGYRLDLNTRKTRIQDLNGGVGEPWMAEILSHLPAKWTPVMAARYLQHCELLAQKYPLYSVLKFAVKSLDGRRREGESEPSMLIVDELVRLCGFHPHLAPFLAAELERFGNAIDKADAIRLTEVLAAQMGDAAARLETDSVLWYLHIIRRVLKRQVRKESWNLLLEMRDDMVTVAVTALCNRARHAIAKECREFEPACERDREERWLSRYELWRVGLLGGDRLSDHEKLWMRVLLDHGVRFSIL